MVVHNVGENDAPLYTVIDELERRRSGRQISTQVFAMMDCDGVCSASIFIELLKTRSIEHAMTVVETTTDLADELKKLGATAVRSVVFLNCGAQYNLVRKKIEFGLHDVAFYVFDSHAPINADNSRADRSIQVFQDYDPDLITLPESDDEEDDEDESSSESGDDGGAGKKRGRSGGTRPMKRRKKVADLYYFHTPAAVTLCQLAHNMSIATSEMVWAAATSLASAIHQGSLDEDSVYKLLLHRVSLWLQKNGHGHNLRVEEDLTMTLYRHWTLKDAVTHTSSMYSALKLVKEIGQRYLKDFFLRVGVDADASRQKYTGLELSVRQSLRAKVDDVVRERYQITNISQLDVIRRESSMPNSDDAYLKEIAAKDMALVVSALLEQKNAHDETGPFYDAWAALKLERSSLERGFSRAIAIQKDVVQQVKTIIDKKYFTSTSRNNKFRIVVLHRAPDVLQNSTVLQRLAAFLMAVFEGRFQKASGRLPLAILMKDPSQECWLCVGAATRPVHEYGNELVKYFDEATRSTNANTANHFIDKAVWQVHEDDFDAWFDALKEISKRDVAEFPDVSPTQDKMTGETGSPATLASSPSTHAESPEYAKDSLSQSAAAIVSAE
jgi:cell division control protein 45